MAYCLEAGEDAGAGLRRIAREELLAASSALAQARAGTRDKAVHEARRSLKRVRSILAIAGDSLEAERLRLRDAGRRLSALRDAAVLLETLDDLFEHHSSNWTARDRLAVRRALIAEMRSTLRWTSVRPKFVRVSSLLAKAAERSARWPLELTDAAVEHLKKRMHKAARRARRTHAPEDFHEWRKRAKQAWHHAQLTGGDVESLGRLQTALGDLHNLDVLYEWLRERGFREAAKLVKQRRRKLADFDAA